MLGRTYIYRAVLALGLLFTAGTLCAADRYISTSGTNLFNTCTDKLAPCRTLSYTLSLASVSDTIHVASGTYEEAGLDLNFPMTIRGEGAEQTILRAGANAGLATSRIFQVNSTGVNIFDLTLKHGRAQGFSSSGGAILNSGQLLLKNCLIFSNQSDNAAGAIQNNGDLLLEFCTVGYNQSSDLGGAIYNSGSATCRFSTIVQNTSDASGGGLYSLGSLSIEYSTVSHNSAGIEGGGIFCEGPAVLYSSTVYGNEALAGGGFSVDLQVSEILDMDFSTIASNQAVLGGGILVKSGEASMYHVLIGGNTASTGPDCSGTLLSEGYNLLSTNTDCTITGLGKGNRINADPALEIYGYQGGPTPTLSIGTNGLAVDRGKSNQAEPLSDQRGFFRFENGRLDIGAFELDDGNPDNDGDGNPDSYEMASGTDPNDSNSVFALSFTRPAPDGVITLRFNGVSSRIYQVEATPSVNAFTNWSTAISLPGSNEQVTAILTGSQQTLTYRVRTFSTP